MKALSVFAMSMVVAVCLLMGCAGQFATPEKMWVPEANVSIHLLQDTLYFPPEDSSAYHFDGWVIVRDNAGVATSGMPVQLSLTQPCDSLVLTDSVHRDTTDAAGRVNFRIYVTGGDCSGNSVIARCEEVSDTCPYIRVLSPPRPSSWTVSLTPDTIFSAPPVDDSILVAFNVLGENGRPFPNYQMTFWANGGRFDVFPPNDSAGHAQGWWHLSSFGNFCLYVSIVTDQDTACVTVLDTTSVSAATHHPVTPPSAISGAPMRRSRS